MTPEPRMPSAINDLESLALAQDPRGEAEDEDDGEALPDIRDADSFFNLPGDDEDDDSRR